MTSPVVVRETTTVYRGATRRYFSKRAAIQNIAWTKVREKYEEQCDCDNGDSNVGLAPESCYFHANRDKFKYVARRYARRFMQLNKGAEQ